MQILWTVEVLSSAFSISGNVDGHDWNPGSPYLYFSYAESGSVPLANGVTYGSFYNGASASSAAGFFSVSAFAVGSYNFEGWAHATAEWRFEPLSFMDKLTIDYNFGYSDALGNVSWGNYTLTDTTTGTTISSINLSQPRLYSSTGWTGSDLINYSFQTNHVYDLALSTNVNSWYDGRTLTVGTNSISVPEPAFLLLPGLGITGLAGVRRKFRN